MKIQNHLFILIELFICSLLVSIKTYSQEQTSQPQYAIKNVNVITMTSSNAVINNATVVVSENRIESINGTIPKNAKIIDGKGKWLIPGLIDTHVHLSTDSYFGPKLPTQAPDFIVNTQDIMTPIIANGVTTVWDLCW